MENQEENKELNLKLDLVEYNNESQKFKVKLSVDSLNIEYQKDLDGNDEKIIVKKSIFEW